MDLVVTDTRDPFTEVFGTKRGSSRLDLEQTIGTPDTTTYEVICQGWEESERGWGQRPDGYSLHLTEEDRASYIKAYWDSMPDKAPAEYERPCGSPYKCSVDAKVYAHLQACENGLRSFGPNPPGAKDGWIRMNAQAESTASSS